MENLRCKLLLLRACSRSTAASGWSHPKLKRPRLVPARGRLTETPVTGDCVELDDGGAIAAIKPRHGAIVRRAPGEATDGQVLAANVDLALVTEPLPDPKARRLERFAALAASGGVPVALVLTKADLDDDGYLTAAQLGAPAGRRRRRRGQRPHRRGDRRRAPAARTRRHRGPARRVRHRQVDARSTRCSARSARRRARSASDGRGRHTTVTRELLTLPGGAFLIDTPGIRDRRPLGRHRRDLRRRRRARPALPLRGLRPRHRAGLRRPRELDPERIAAWRKLQRELAWIEDRRAAHREREARGSEITLHLRKLENESGRGESNPHLWLGKPTS